MPRIAFFSDDVAGPMCAQLTCLGLSPVSAGTTLALPEADGDQGCSIPRPGVQVVDLGRNPNAYEVERCLAHAIRSGADIVAALPLHAARDRAVRLQFDAVIVVGDEPVAAARAMREARYQAVSPGDVPDNRRETVPAWFLPGSGQSLLMTKATLSPLNGPRLPFSTRMLPMVLPRLTGEARSRVGAGEANASVVATGTLLAALALMVAFDPTAKRIEAADLVAMMAARDTEAERDLGERLRGLADAYERVAGEDASARPHGVAARPRDRRTPVPRVAPATAVPVRGPLARSVRSYGV